MTRINLIPVEELSDQHLLAEYRELPRIVNSVAGGKILFKDIPPTYRLGAGHVKFFYDKTLFLCYRYKAIYKEMIFRGFKPNPRFSYESLVRKISDETNISQKTYVFSQSEIELSRNRLIEKIKKKPQWYKWTNRNRPNYACIKT